MQSVTEPRVQCSKRMILPDSLVDVKPGDTEPLGRAVVHRWTLKGAWRVARVNTFDGALAQVAFGTAWTIVARSSLIERYARLELEQESIDGVRPASQTSQGHLCSIEPQSTRSRAAPCFGQLITARIDHAVANESLRWGDTPITGRWLLITRLLKQPSIA